MTNKYFFSRYSFNSFSDDSPTRTTITRVSLVCARIECPERPNALKFFQHLQNKKTSTRDDCYTYPSNRYDPSTSEFGREGLLIVCGKQYHSHYVYSLISLRYGVIQMGHVSSLRGSRVIADQTETLEYFFGLVVSQQDDARSLAVVIFVSS